MSQAALTRANEEARKYRHRLRDTKASLEAALHENRRLRTALAVALLKQSGIDPALAELLRFDPASMLTADLALDASDLIGLAANIHRLSPADKMMLSGSAPEGASSQPHPAVAGTGSRPAGGTDKH